MHTGVGGSGSSSKGQRQPRGGIQPSFKARPIRAIGREYRDFDARHAATRASLSEAVRKSLKYYEGAGARTINRSLATGVKLGKRDAKHTANILRATAGSTVGQPLVAYRGVPSSLIGRYLRATPGRMVQDPAFVSTSLRKSVAVRRGTKLLLRIHLPPQTKGVYLSGKLRELLIAPGQTARVLGKRVRRNGRIEMDVEYLP